MPLNGIGFGEMLVIGMLVLIVFGPRRLPEITRSLGKAMREFKRGMNEIQRELEAADRETRWSPPPPAPQPPPASSKSAAAAAAGAAAAGSVGANAEEEDGSAEEAGAEPDRDAASAVDPDPDEREKSPAARGVPDEIADPAAQYTDPWSTDSSRPSIVRPRPAPDEGAAGESGDEGTRPAADAPSGSSSGGGES